MKNSWIIENFYRRAYFTCFHFLDWINFLYKVLCFEKYQIKPYLHIYSRRRVDHRLWYKLCTTVRSRFVQIHKRSCCQYSISFWFISVLQSSQTESKSKDFYFCFFLNWSKLFWNETKTFDLKRKIQLVSIWVPWWIITDDSFWHKRYQW